MCLVFVYPQRLDTASMGPCPFRHGYTDIKTASPCNCTRFNGAMPFQAWICVPSSSIIDNISSASMGPCPFRHGYAERIEFTIDDLEKLQWGHALSGMDTMQWRRWMTQDESFNGAMPFQAWIPTLCARLMRLRMCFNGAMPFQAWISAWNALLMRCQSQSLQWGHALSGMDIQHWCYQIARDQDASMGPCPFRHGYLLIHGVLLHLLIASMGPCPFRHGYASQYLSIDAALERFNGAMPFQAWIYHNNSFIRAFVYMLQWGHALSGMDIPVHRGRDHQCHQLQWGHALSGMDMVDGQTQNDCS